MDVLGCCAHTIVYTIFWLGFVLNFTAGLLWMSIMKKYVKYDFFSNVMPWMIAFVMFFIDLFMLSPFWYNCYHFLPVLTGHKYYDQYVSMKKARESGKSLYKGSRTCERVSWFYFVFSFLKIA